MPADLIGVRDAARRLGVSYPTLKQWIYKGTLRTVQTAGGHHRVAESEIERFLARRGTGSNKAGSSAPRRRSGPPAVLVALSGRNQLRGIVEEVRTDGLMAQIRLRIGEQRLLGGIELGDPRLLLVDLVDRRIVDRCGRCPVAEQ